MKTYGTLKDHVYNYIADQILQGNLNPGERINEHGICDELNISRTPVREALIQLSSEGIIHNMSRKGFIVKAVTEQEVQELYLVIGILDGSAAKMACDNLTSQELLDMEFYINTIDLAIQAGNFEMYHKQQYTFHQIYINKCGNTALIESIEKLKNKLLKKRYGDEDVEQTKLVLSQTNEDHRQILKLFQAKDKDGLFNFISETHWKVAYAKYDVIT